MKVWEACESRGSLNLSVQLLLFRFASNQLTLCGMPRYTVSIFQLHQELSETVVISCHLFINNS